MKQTRLLMGMPITVEILDQDVTGVAFDRVFEYFQAVDNRYSTYKADSEISQINRGLPRGCWSREMRTVLKLCEQTKRQTDGYFDIERHGQLDPSGLVKGWAIKNAADLLTASGFHNYYVEAGGDIQVSGRPAKGETWRVGVRNPFNRDETIKTLAVTSQGIATSGSYIRGQHIYDPHTPDKTIDAIVGLTVIGPNIYEADRFATAAYAMGKNAARFIESLDGFEAYMIGRDRIATFTSNFETYVVQPA